VEVALRGAAYEALVGAAYELRGLNFPWLLFTGAGAEYAVDGAYFPLPLTGAE